jgi:hypothetical protein
MRNLFDQYSQPENRLTHALVTTLGQERKLLRPFLLWLGIEHVPPVKELSICEQQIPGSPQLDATEAEAKGLPDACVFNEDGWLVLFECKIQATISADQIVRHRGTAVRYGFAKPLVVVVAVDRPGNALPTDVIAVTWADLYCWFSSKASGSYWIQEFLRYMQVFERRMLAQEYDIRGTITVFDGLKFDDDNPYTYREGKRLIRLLGDQLQQRKDLIKIGVDPQGSRRTAITGSDSDQVWDYLPLRAARDAKFTAFPHFTMVLHRQRVRISITVPNGVQGGFRSKLASCGPEGFLQLLAQLETNLRPVLKRSRGATPFIYLTQRHFTSRRGASEMDARIEADLRTAIPGRTGGVKYQPQWLDAVFALLVNRRSNMQTGVEAHFRYDCPIVRSPKAVDLLADTWKALVPLVDFVVNEK